MSKDWSLRDWPEGMRRVARGEGEIVKIEADYKYDLAVVIGRFQVPRPHEGHVALLKEAAKRAPQVLVLVGSAPRLTRRNPLPAALVCSQLRDACDQLNIRGSIMPLPDMRSDSDWVKRVDEMIGQCIPWTGKAVMLFGQDARNAGVLGDPRSAIVYKLHGRHPIEVHHFDGPRATELRRDAPAIAYRRRNEDVALGMIAAFELMSSHVVCAADVLVCWKEPQPSVLLGRKANETKWRLLGGMVEPGEAPVVTAIREAYEEAKAVLDDVKAIGAFVVNDWRFTQPESGVLTHLHLGWVKQGIFTPGDDIVAVKSFVARELKDDIHEFVVEEHQGLVSIALDAMFAELKGETKSATEPIATDG